MIQVRLRVGDLGRVRFAYSPLVEVAESLYMLSSGSIAPVHRAWHAAVRERLSTTDLELLQAVVPARSYIADFLLPGATYPARTITDQLERLAGLPADRIRRDIEDAWHGQAPPARFRQLAAAGSAGPALLGEALAASGSQGPSSLTYTARGVGKIWGASEAPPADDDTLGALLSRSRAAILTSPSSHTPPRSSR